MIFLEEMLIACSMLSFPTHRESPCIFYLCCILWLSSKHFNVQIVDLATLTGACIVALGPSIAGTLGL